ncbi:MAG: Rieske (2Fe-2S) protein [Phycisphaerales bacterium]|nr:Rieske (2Fe-2S) protein [Phycisphaerales bacterium]
MMTLGGAVASVPVLGYLFGGATRRYKTEWVDLGPLEQFPAGETRFATFITPISSPNDGATAKTACWVRCIKSGKFQVFAINCAHLGCPVRWFEQSKLFLCPCHGGVYYQDGSRASGPPPRGLFEYPWKVTDGHLAIDAGMLPGLQETAYFPEASA